MPDKKSKNKNWQMPTTEFIGLWVKALTKPKDDQWDWMVSECWKTFSSKDANETHLNNWKKSWKTASDDVCHKYITDKVYSKCSNIRSSFKSAGQKIPNYPFGKNKKGAAKVDWPGQAGRFDPSDMTEPDDSTDKKS